jgi:predicted Fe-Mo cluster-binding NifX family protein
MKIAFPSCSNSLDGSLEPLFGKTPSFLVLDTETNQLSILSNSKDPESPKGKGIVSAQILIKSKTDILLCQHCGPQAFKILRSGGVKVFLGQADTAREIYEHYQNGLLAELLDPDVPAHYGSGSQCRRHSGAPRQNRIQSRTSIL